jgi:anaerobic selenocysteine-containing dehydrogenase
VKEALEKVPYIVSFGSFLDETSILSDLILPDHSFLESWVDHMPESGTTKAVASVAPPAMLPLHQTRSMADVLLEAGRSLSAPLGQALPWQSYEEMLQITYGGLPAPSDQPADAEVADAWTTIQQQGGWWSEIPAQAAAPMAQPAPAPSAFVEPQFDGEAGEYSFHFLPYASQAFLDGSLAHLPWLQELPDVLSTAMWSSWVEINPQTAASLGIEQGDLVEITSTQGSLNAPALISPGIAPDVLAMPVGQGHESFTRYASGRGTNPIRILAPILEPETGTLAWAATRVRLSRAGGKGELILFAGGMREHESEHR